VIGVERLDRARRSGRRADRWAPPLVLALMVAGYAVGFGFLVYRQQSNFGTFGFDLGIRDQGIWLVAHGHTPFMTVRGLDFFAENVEPISLLFVPFYWLGAGPHLLIAAHTAFVAAGAIPLWLLARDRFENRWLALVPSVAYLLYPAVHWVTWWAYHPDSMAITPLLFAWWFAVRRRWGWYALACLAALACKEDVALAVVMLGVAVAFVVRPATPPDPQPAGRSTWSARTVGLGTVAVAISWFMLCTQVIIPWRNHHETPFYLSFFPSFGHTMPQILFNIARHPSRVLRLAKLHDRLFYDQQLFLPVAGLPLFGLAGLLVAAPQFGVNTIVQRQHAATIQSQYASLLIVGVFLGTVEGMAWLAKQLGRGRGWRRLTRSTVLSMLGAVVVVTSVVSTLNWGLAPLSRSFHSGLWVAHIQHGPEVHRAVSLVGPRDGVSVTYYFTPHLTHRQYVYEFPNPWINSNYGNKDQDVGRPAKVDWLVLDRRTLGSADTTLLDQLTGPGGSFAIVEDANGILVARRTRPG
jgi:uncharacterized membrane protein